MKVLSSEEINKVHGGVWQAVGGAAIGLGAYAYNSHRANRPMTLSGAATAIGFGAMTGGLGGAAVRAAGGGIVGNVAWRPGFAAINASGQGIAAQRK